MGSLVLRIDPVTGLTPPEELFCRAQITNGNASECYRQAFPQSKKWKQTTVTSRACELNAEVRIRERMAALRAEMRAQTGLTLQTHIDNLIRLRDLAAQAGQYGPAVTAEAHCGKVSGLYVEKVEHSGSVNIFASRSDEDI